MNQNLPQQGEDECGLLIGLSQHGRTRLTNVLRSGQL
jgi:hypothetical protein